MDTHAVMGDFVSAVLRGKVMDSLVKKEPDGSVRFPKPYRPAVDTSAPVFDFAGVPLDPSKFTTEQVEEFTEGDRIVLPFPECFFVMSGAAGSPNGEAKATDVVYHMAEHGGGNVTGRMYYRFRHHPGVWFEEFLILTWGTGERFKQKDTRRIMGTLGVVSGAVGLVAADEEHVYGCRARFRVGAAAWLLSLPPDDGERVIRREVQAVQVPKALTLGRKSLRPAPVTVINLNVAELDRVVTNRAGSHAPRQPHDRRAHFRRLRDGRVIPVKASRIHGGSPDGRLYVVKID